MSRLMVFEVMVLVAVSITYSCNTSTAAVGMQLI